MLLPIVRLLSLLLAPAAEERIVFLVDPYQDESGFYAEPIVIIKGNTFASVGNDSDTNFDAYRVFSAKYFAKGKTYPVYSNDVRLGDMMVIDRDTEFACMQLTAQVQMKYTAGSTLTLGEPGLGFSGFRPQKPLSTALAVKADSMQAMSLALKEFANRKLSKGALKSVQLDRIRKVDLDGDGDLETIATFETSRSVYSKVLKTNSMMIYFLALVIDGEKVVYSYYTQGAEEGDEKGNFASRQDIAGVSDLDSDGVAEIIFRNFYYESWDFTIVKKRANRWQKMWQGSGGGC